MKAKQAIAILMATAALGVVGCFGRPRVQFTYKISPPPVSPITAQFQWSDGAVTGAIRNNGDAPIDVLWHRSQFITPDGVALEIMHSGGRSVSAARDIEADVQEIPPHATISEVIVPKRVVHFDREGWTSGGLLPVGECGPVRCEDPKPYIGLRYRLRLTTMSRGGSESAQEWELVIIDAYVTRWWDSRRNL